MMLLSYGERLRKGEPSGSYGISRYIWGQHCCFSRLLCVELWYLRGLQADDLVWIAVDGAFSLEKCGPMTVACGMDCDY